MKTCGHFCLFWLRQVGDGCATEVTSIIPLWYARARLGKHQIRGELNYWTRDI